MPNTSSDNKKDTVYLLPNQNDDKNELDLGELLATLIDNKWPIAFITVIVLIIGTAYSFLSNPIYQAKAMLQVQQSQGTLQRVVNIEQGSNIAEIKIPTIAEIELITSRTILETAVKNLNLDVISKPKYFPVIGEAISRRFQLHNVREFLQHDIGRESDKISSPLFGLSGYAWGGEFLHVDTLTIPANGLDKKLILIAGKEGHYRLMYKDKLVLEGEVGKLASTQLEDEQQAITLFVSQLKSRTNTQFMVMRQDVDDVIDKIGESLSIVEKGKETGILELTMESSDPALAFQTLNEIVNIYFRQNVEHKSLEAQKTLDFLEKQLPKLKEQLDAATNALNEYRISHGSIDLDLETQNVLKGVVDIETQITLLQQKRDEFRQKFTDAHPSIVSIDKQIGRLQGIMNHNNSKIQTLPETQQIILRLARDVKVNTELYTSLLNTAQALRVAKVGKVGNVRIIDYAKLPTKSIRPQKARIFALSIILGLFLGSAWVFIRKSLNSGVEDPDLIEKQLNIPVYATIPHSAQQQKIDIKLRKKRTNEPIILALESNDDLAIEGLRSLRTTLHFAFLEAQNNIIMMTGPSPGVGKSFISINLATVLADAGKKILLIDGDLRKGLIYKSLGVRREQGLSEIISNALPLDIAIHKIPLANFDFIASGSIPPNPSELLLHERFGILLKGISAHYDHVIIDSPPILAVTDAAIIGRMASATLMVIRSGQHSMRELELSTKRLLQAGVNIKGIVLNDVPESSSSYGYEYGKYAYSHQKYK